MSKLAAIIEAAYIEKVVAEAPPLSAEQRDRVIAILRNPKADASAPAKPQSDAHQRESVRMMKVAAENRNIAREVTACAICSTAEGNHGGGIGGHDFTPREDLSAVIEWLRTHRAAVDKGPSDVAGR